MYDKMMELTGYDTGNLEQCERTNATWLECPVANYTKSDNGSFSMGVAIHNPSNVEMKKAEILVPKGSYRALGYSSFLGTLMFNLTVELKCRNDYTTVNKTNANVDSCVLLIDQVVPPRGMALVEVICDGLTPADKNETVRLADKNETGAIDEILENTID